MYKTTVLTIFILLLLISCAPSSEKFNPLSRTNPILNGVKLKTKSSDLDIHNDHALSISKKAQHHLFLMTTSQRSDEKGDNPSILANKIVYFKLEQSKIQMFEKSDTEKKDTLLAEFPVIKQLKDSLHFDFAGGISKIFIKRSTFTGEDGYDRERIFKINKSILYSASIKGPRLVIDHYVKIEIPATNGNSLKKIHMKYSFKSYQENKNFTGHPHPDRRKVSFFETHPYAGKSYITRFSPNKKITFYLAGDIPSKYLNAVKDGILYWNKVVGKKLIEVKSLPKEVDPLAPDKNVFNWINSHSLNYAYTNLSVNPVTGEILKAYIHFPSLEGTSYHRLLKNLVEVKGPTVPKKLEHPFKIKLQKFKSATITVDNIGGQLEKMTENLPQLLTTSLQQDVDDSLFEKITSDIIRTFVAHEMGHALGLRHNFAGSLGTNIGLQNHEDVYSYYIHTSKLPKNIIPTASVMDYLPFLSAAMTGSWIKNAKSPLPYDRWAFHLAYNRFVPIKKKLPFCSDSDLEKFKDCNKFDRFKNPIHGAWYDFMDSIQTSASGLVKKVYSLERETFLDISPDSVGTTIGLNSDIRNISNKMKSFLSYFEKNTSYLQISEDELFNHLKITLKEMRKDFGQLALEPFTPRHTIQNGKSTHVTPIAQQYRSIFMARFLDLAMHDSTEKHNFDETMKHMDNCFNRFEMQTLMVHNINLQHFRFHSNENETLDENFSEYLFRFSYKILFSEGNTPITPKYDYTRLNFNIRKQALALLTHKFTILDEYSVDTNIKRIIEKHKNNIKQIESMDNDLPYDFEKFVENEKRIFLPLIKLSN